MNPKSDLSEIFSERFNGFGKTYILQHLELRMDAERANILMQNALNAERAANEPQPEPTTTTVSAAEKKKLAKIAAQKKEAAEAKITQALQDTLNTAHRVMDTAEKDIYYAIQVVRCIRKYHDKPDAKEEDKALFRYMWMVMHHLVLPNCVFVDPGNEKWGKNIHCPPPYAAISFIDQKEPLTMDDFVNAYQNLARANLDLRILNDMVASRIPYAKEHSLKKEFIGAHKEIIRVFGPLIKKNEFEQTHEFVDYKGVIVFNSICTNLFQSTLEEYAELENKRREKITAAVAEARAAEVKEDGSASASASDSTPTPTPDSDPAPKTPPVTFHSMLREKVDALFE